MAPPPHPSLPPSLRQSLLPLWRARRRFDAANCSLFGTLVALGALCLAVLLAEHQIGSQTLLIVRGAQSVFGLGAILAIFFALGALGAPVGQIERTMRFTQRLWPEGQSAVETARAALEGKLAPNASAALVTRHLRALGEALAAKPFAASLQALTWRRRLGIIVVLCAAAGIARQLCAQNPRGWAYVKSALRNERPKRVVDEELLLTAHVDVTPPAYSKRQAKHLAFGARVELLKDSVVSLRVKTKYSGRLCAYVMRGDDAVAPQTESVSWLPPDDTPTLCFEPQQDQSHAAALTLAQSSSLYFFIDEPDGMRTTSAIGKKLIAQDNAAPLVNLVTPLDDDALGANQALNVRWEAEDDLGCERAEVVITGDTNDVLALPSRIELEDTSDLHRARGALSIPAATLDAYGHETLEIFVRVYDFASSPNHFGKSETRKIKRISPSAHHRHLLEREREVFDLWVDWLAAEQPENEANSPKMPLALDEALFATVALAQALKDDSLANAHEQLAWQNAARHAQQARAQLGLTTRDDTKRQAILEADVLYLDDLLAKGGLGVARDGAKALKEAQNDLRSLIAQLRGNTSPELKQALLAKLALLAQRLNEVVGRMHEIRESVGHQSQNIDAQSQHGTQDTFEQLADAVQNGDAKGAEEQLQALDNLLNQLTESLDKDEGQLGESRNRALLEQMDALERDAMALAREQDKLAAELENKEEASHKSQAKDGDDKKSRGGMTPAEGAALFGRQTEIAKRTQKLSEALDKLDEQAPVLGEAERAAIAAAQQQIAESARALQGQKINEAAQAARLGGENLKRLHHALSQSKGQSSKLPLPSGSSSPRHAASAPGAQGQDKIDITKERTPTRSELRERIRKAAREKAAPKYETEVKNFYDELMRQ